MPWNPCDLDLNNVAMINNKRIFRSSKVGCRRRIVGQNFQQGRDGRRTVGLAVDLENVLSADDCGCEFYRDGLVGSHVAAGARGVDERD